MESKIRGFVVLFGVAALMLMLFAPGQCQSAPSTDAKRHKGHKMDLKACDPMCFFKCAVDKGDLYCYGQCLLACLPVGKPDDPRDICLTNCAVPGCAKLCTKEHPFPVKAVETCLQTCSDDCDENESDKIQKHH